MIPQSADDDVVELAVFGWLLGVGAASSLASTTSFSALCRLQSGSQLRPGARGELAGSDNIVVCTLRAAVLCGPPSGSLLRPCAKRGIAGSSLALTASSSALCGSLSGSRLRPDTGWWPAWDCSKPSGFCCTSLITTQMFVTTSLTAYHSSLSESFHAAV